MRSKKRINPPEKSSELTDLEVAKKMIKIFQSAQDRKLDFALSFKTVKTLLTHSSCYYTNKKFEEEGQNARSFDRIDSDKGYIEGNVVACTIDINSKKSNLTYEEIELLYKKLSGFKKEQEHEIFSSLAGDVSVTDKLGGPGNDEAGFTEDRLGEGTD
jgi:hypothetical protein